MAGTAFGTMLIWKYSKYKNKCNSFNKSTLVVTEKGLIPIYDIRIGDKVFSYNEQNQSIKLQNVIHIIKSNGSKKLIDIELINDEIIISTDNHLFWTVDLQKWKDAGSLTSKNILLNLQEKNISIKNSSHYMKEAVVYNLTIANDHTYFVGKSEILVHNANCAVQSAGNWKFDPEKDLDWRGCGRTYRHALNKAFELTGASKSEFVFTKWSMSIYGKSFPSEYRVVSGPNKGAVVNIDTGHTHNGPAEPHVGYQKPGKRKQGGTVRGHIILDIVPFWR